VTPPTSAEDDNNTDTLLQNATHVLLTEAAALNAAARLYSTSPIARSNLSTAVEAITSAQRRPNNKLVFCGVGKSAYIAQKLTATSKSLGIKASFLHACEALHGDLGDVRPGDVVCFVTFSGKTPELMGVLPHLPERLTIIALCGKAELQECPLLAGRTGILLSAPILQSEESSFGVSAPTTSTTVALAVGDMMVLTVAEGLHGEKKAQLFRKNHPGGAIGMT
ncbi:SIS domain-containing protein, partial [Polychaeton citri CBS 116435]